MRKKNNASLIIPVNEHIRLRSWEYTDARSLAILANDKSIYDNLRDYFPFPYNERDAKSFITSVISLQGNSLFWAIEYDGELAGSIGAYFKSDIYRGLCEVGYWIGKPFREKGIASHSIDAVVRYIFSFYKVNKIYAEVFSDNIASRMALKKAGFIEEACLKNHALKNGREIDVVICSIFRKQ